MVRSVSSISSVLSPGRLWAKETSYARQSNSLCPAGILEHVARCFSSSDRGPVGVHHSHASEQERIHGVSAIGTVGISPLGGDRRGNPSPRYSSVRGRATGGRAYTVSRYPRSDAGNVAAVEKESPAPSAQPIKPELVAQKILMCEDPGDVFGTTVLTPVSISELPTTYLSAAARAAALSHITDAGFLDVLLHRVVLSLDKESKEMKENGLVPADVCNIIESFSELDFCHSIELKTAVSRYMLRNLQLFSGDMLGHTLRSFANLNFYDDELLERVLTYMSENAADFSAENVADVVYAFSKCGFCHPDLISLVDQAGSMLLKEALHDNGEAIAGIVDAYSRVGCAESETLDALVELVTQSPDKIPANALASTLASAIRLGSEDQGMMNRVMESLLPRLDDLETRVLVEVVVCLGGLGVRPKDERFLETLVDEVLPYRIGEMEDKQVSDVVDGLNKLGFYVRGLDSLMLHRKKNE